MEKNPGELIPHGLTLPPAAAKKARPYYGLLELEAKKGAKELFMWTPHEVFKAEPKSFTDLFRDLLVLSVFVSAESV